MLEKFKKYSETKQVLIVIAIVILLILLYIIIWYSVGWESVTFTSTDTHASNIVLPSSSGDLTRLKFKNCIFTITNSSGTVVGTKDVTSTLYNMVHAYDCVKKGTCKNMPNNLQFFGTTTKDTNGNPIQVINSMSFYVEGINDGTSGATVNKSNASSYKANLIVNYKESLFI